MADVETRANQFPLHMPVRLLTTRPLFDYRPSTSSWSLLTILTNGLGKWAGERDRGLSQSLSKIRASLTVIITLASRISWRATFEHFLL